MFRFLSVYNDNEVMGIFEEGNKINFGQACIIALIAIIIVFVVLCLIIGSIKIQELCVRKFSKKKEAPVESESIAPVATALAPAAPITDSKNIEDDDMMAAVLVATIDYAEENAKKGIKKDIKLKSVKKIG